MVWLDATELGSGPGPEQSAEQDRNFDEAGPGPEQGRNRPEPRPRAAGSVVPQASGQLQIVMQEWLLPLVEKIGTLEREVGHEQGRRQAAEEAAAAGAAVIGDLRRRAETAEAEAARLAAQLAERDRAVSPLHESQGAEYTPQGQAGDATTQLAKKRWWWPF
ncbi:MAG TPA: hypothetical protein VNL35_16760 [Chloroflexota bacterium]|nr:hypothetical protein [Chloroflexota bacterium]